MIPKKVINPDVHSLLITLQPQVKIIAQVKKIAYLCNAFKKAKCDGKFCNQQVDSQML